MTGAQDEKNRRTIREILVWDVAVLILAVGYTALRHESHVTVSVALGGIVGALNFWLTGWVVRRTFVADPKRSSGGWLMLKFLGFFGLVGWIIWQVRPQSVGFGAGFATVIVAIVCKAIVDAIRGVPDEEEIEPLEIERDGEAGRPSRDDVDTERRDDDRP